MSVSAAQANREHVLAVSRDFISQPRLSKYPFPAVKKFWAIYLPDLQNFNFKKWAYEYVDSATGSKFLLIFEALCWNLNQNKSSIVILILYFLRFNFFSGGNCALAVCKFSKSCDLISWPFISIIFFLTMIFTFDLLQSTKQYQVSTVLWSS